MAGNVLILRVSKHFIRKKLVLLCFLCNLARQSKLWFMVKGVLSFCVKTTTSYILNSLANIWKEKNDTNMSLIILKYTHQND